MRLRLLSALLACTFCALAIPVGAVVHRVDNPADPTDPAVTLQLEELWRIGGEDDEETLLGVVNDVVADDQGRLYLLDIQLLEVQVYGPDGAFLHTIGRAGDGPGEFRRATHTLFMPDGTLGIVQQMPGRIVKLATDGLPAGEFTLGADDPASGGFHMLRRAQFRGGQLVASGARMTRGETGRTAVHFIAPLDPAGGTGNPFLDVTSVRDFGNSTVSEKDGFFPHDGGWTVGPEGRTYIAPARNSYEIDVYSPDGAHERTIARSYRSLDRTAEESEEARENMIPRRRRNRGGLDVVVERTVRDILGLRVDDDGRLWVLPSRGLRNQPAGIHSTWDVFDAQGVFRHTVSVACEGRGGMDALFFTDGGLAVLVKEHAEAMKAFRGRGGETDEEEIEARPLEVVVYRIVN